MKIIETAPAPNCRRVRIYLAEKGIEDIEFEQIDIMGGANLEGEYKEKSFTGKVPLLQLDDGTCISESVAIKRYFEALHPEPPLFGRNPREIALVEMWDRIADYNMMLPVGMCFQHTTGVFKDRMTPFPEFGANCGEQVQKFFTKLDAHLEHNEFLAGDYFSVADISMFCPMDFAKVVKIRPDKAAHPHLMRWYDTLKQRPAFSA